MPDDTKPDHTAALRMAQWQIANPRYLPAGPGVITDSVALAGGDVGVREAK